MLSWAAPLPGAEFICRVFRFSRECVNTLECYFKISIGKQRQPFSLSIARSHWTPLAKLCRVALASRCDSSIWPSRCYSRPWPRPRYNSVSVVFGALEGIRQKMASQRRGRDSRLQSPLFLEPQTEGFCRVSVLLGALEDVGP